MNPSEPLFLLLLGSFMIGHINNFNLEDRKNGFRHKISLAKKQQSLVLGRLKRVGVVWDCFCVVPWGIPCLS